MTDYLLLFVGTVLVNNFVLVKFLGLCRLWAFPKAGNGNGYGAGDDLRHDAGVHLRVVD
jgi:Na+-translocating ferredoxin:NAD+ oxidoreductase RnfA subunit